MSPAWRTILARAAICLVLVALCLAIYLPGLPNDFVWDDDLYIRMNPGVTGGLSWEGIRWAFTTFHAGNWHPLTWLSHQADASFFGPAPWGPHLVNLLFHAANSVLTFLLLNVLTGTLWNSALAGVLFAVHPLHVESVAWACERKDVLSTFLWLLAFLAYLQWLRRRSLWRYLPLATLYALSLMAKSMPVTFPFLLLLLDWWPLGRLVPGRRLPAALEKIPLLLLAAASSTVTLKAQASFALVNAISGYYRLANAAGSYAAYLWKTLWPVRLSLLYPLYARPPALPKTALALAFLAFVTAAAGILRRRFPFLIIGWLWYLGALVPVIGLVQVGSQSMADRYMYVPLIGLSLALIWGIDALTVRWAGRAAPFAMAVLLVSAFLSAAAASQVLTWRNAATAFGRAIAVSPNNTMAHYNLAVHYQGRGELDEAEKHYNEALRIRPDYAVAQNNLGAVLQALGRGEEALVHYRHAAQTEQPQVAALADFNIGAYFQQRGDLPQADRYYREAIRNKPDYAEAHHSLGVLLVTSGRREEALFHLGEAVTLSPRNALYRANFGTALADLGIPARAVVELSEALRLDPSLEFARENLVRARSAVSGASSGARLQSGAGSAPR